MPADFELDMGERTVRSRVGASSPTAISATTWREYEPCLSRGSSIQPGLK